MSVEKKIEHTLSDNFNLSHLEVINESHMHSGPNTESHFKVILAVSYTHLTLPTKLTV